MGDRARPRSPRRPARPRGGARRAGWSDPPSRLRYPADQADIDGAADRLRAGLRCCPEPVFQISRDGKVRRSDDSGCVLQDLVARQSGGGIAATDREGVPRARRAERFKPEGGQDPRRPFVPGIGEDERPRPLVQGPESLVLFALRCHHASCPSGDATPAYETAIPALVVACVGKPSAVRMGPVQPRLDAIAVRECPLWEVSWRFERDGVVMGRGAQRRQWSKKRDRSQVIALALKNLAGLGEGPDRGKSDPIIECDAGFLTSWPAPSQSDPPAAPPARASGRRSRRRCSSSAPSAPGR